MSTFDDRSAFPQSDIPAIKVPSRDFVLEKLERETPWNPSYWRGNLEFNTLIR